MYIEYKLDKKYGKNIAEKTRITNPHQLVNTLELLTKLENLSDIVFEEGNMSHGGTTAISVYNKDQKTIVNTFEERVNKLENNAYYLFFVENVQFKDRSIAGYMPLQRQVGFIYDNPGLNIIAHELGHGAFNLWHTFSPDNFIATEHTTQNLLDYKGGTDLWKHQWQLVQSPDKMVFGWLQDEEEGEYSTGGINKNTLVFSGDNNYQEIATRINEESVCYYGNEDNSKIKLEFRPILEGKEEYPYTIYVKTEVIYNQKNINDAELVYKVGKDKKSGGYSSKKAFTFELESKVSCYKDITVNCYWSVDGENNWQQVMEYAPIVYTTLRQAANDQYGNKCNLDEHLLYFTCSLLPNYNEQATFNAIWTKIEGLDLNTNDFGLNTNLPIGYYSSHEVNNFVSLMKYNSGICNAFQDLMIKALQNQGISSSNVQISLDRDESFLVKSWDFKGEGSSGNAQYPYINYYDLYRYENEVLKEVLFEPRFISSSGKYRWNGAPEVERIPSDASNLGGQNNNKPPAYFTVHQVVEYNGRIYDPSYGKSFKDIQEWKKKSIDGVYIDGGIKDLSDGTKVNTWQIRKQ